MSIKRAQQIAGGLVSDAARETELVVPGSHIGACTQQAGHKCRFKALRLAVCYIQDRRHLIAVLHAESAGGENDGLHHIGVDETQTLLLPGANQQRTQYFGAVHVDTVLVKVAAAHIVLAAQFVMAAHSRLSGNDRLHGAAVGIGRKTYSFGVYVLHTVTAAAGGTDIDVFERVV